MVGANYSILRTFREESERLSDSTRQESMWPLFTFRAYDEHKTNEKKTKQMRKKQNKFVVQQHDALYLVQSII